MNVNLTGQVAFVTGAGRGIGRASALALAQAGADIALNDLAAGPELDGIAAEIISLGRQALILPGDVSDQPAVENMVRTAAEQFGRLDIAVSSAVFSDRQLLYEADMNGFRRTIDVTMWGAFHLLQATAQRVIEQKRPGSIVLISSPHAFIPVPRAMAYNMAKAAVDQMARTAAVELAEHRIRVNVIHPGWVDTPGERKYATEEQIARGGARLPMGRLAKPEDIGRGVVFLSDPASEYITGSSLLIDGASTLPWWARRGSGIPD